MRGRLNLKRAPQRVVRRLARTAAGERVLWSLARSDPELFIEAMGPRLNRAPRLGNVETWPETLDGFDDLAFLFASTPLNHGIVSLAVDEAAYLYRIVRGLDRANIAEIGRYKGGSTLLIAAAMDSESTLWSYDLHVKLMTVELGPEIDAEIERALERYGLADRVHLIVGDSKLVDPPAADFQLVFVDGDHSYEGVRGDYLNWRPALRPGGHLLFHDAAAHRPFAAGDPTVMRLITEIRATDCSLDYVGGVGAFAHFRLAADVRKL
jgi:predicted O-methyltransferase YrrM